MNAASREKFKKQISFIKIHYNYEKFSRQTEEVSTRRAIIYDILHNYPTITDLDYRTMMHMDIIQLHQLIERKKLNARMELSAIKIQRNFRWHLFRKFCFHKTHRENKAAR